LSSNRCWSGLHIARRALATALGLVSAVGLGGCQALLPDAREDTQVVWTSFDEAREAIERIEPFRTTRSELAEQGLNPDANPGVTLLSYPDIVQRFASGLAVPPELLDPGVRRCLTAGRDCTGYAIAIRRIKRERVGNFFLDAFAFKRETLQTGFTFTAVLLFVNDHVVYAVHSGQPNIRDKSVVRNPLGPLQGWGEAFRPRW
jgi:hypothetical protein